MCFRQRRIASTTSVRSPTGQEFRAVRQGQWGHRIDLRASRGDLLLARNGAEKRATDIFSSCLYAATVSQRGAADREGFKVKRPPPIALGVERKGLDLFQRVSAIGVLFYPPEPAGQPSVGLT